MRAEYPAVDRMPALTNTCLNLKVIVHFKNWDTCEINVENPVTFDVKNLTSKMSNIEIKWIIIINT